MQVIVRYHFRMVPTKEPRISVVIPAFNEARYLPATLESLSRQDFTGHVEVIVVDNNSTDSTAEIARKYGARVICETRRGVCHARQTGTENCRGEIVVSTDADTTFPTSWLSMIEKTFSECPTCVGVAGPCRFSNAPWWGALYPKFLFSFVNFLALVTGHVFYITATNISFKRSAWSGYDTRLTQGGDELDLLRNLQHQGKVVFLRRNVTITSARRLQRGLFYNIFVTFLYYYAFGYLVNRLFRRTVLQTAPSFRTEIKAPRLSMKTGVNIAFSGLLVVLTLWTPFGRELNLFLTAPLRVVDSLY